MAVQFSGATPKTAGLGLCDRNDVAALVQAAQGVDSLPSTAKTQFGSGTASFNAVGNIFELQTGTAVSPGSTANDNVLAVYSIPANTFDIAGRTVTINAWGNFGATANNKNIKIIFDPSVAVVGSAVTGGTTIASTGTVATNGGGWYISGNVTKYGAAGSNTQVTTSNGAIAGATHAGTSAAQFTTANESGAILIAITGNAATATSDIQLYLAEITAFN